MKTNRTTLIITEIAILAALALALDYIGALTTGFLYPEGGSISIAIVPIMVISFRRGLIPGITTGFIVGTIQAVYQGHILQIFQYFLDYPIAFALVGFAGVFTYFNKRKVTTFNLILGAVIAGLLRFFSHYLAGIIFWSSYTPPGMKTSLYSLTYNGAYMVPTIILSTIVIYLLYKYARQLFEVD